MKATETCGHDKNDNYLEKEREKEKKRQGGKKGVLFNEKLYWVNQVQKKKWVSSVSLGAEAFRVICCRLQLLKLLLSLSCISPCGLNKEEPVQTVIEIYIETNTSGVF